MTAALRVVGRSALADPWRTVDCHLFPVFGHGVPLSRLPRDGAWLTISDDDLVEAFDATLPDCEDPTLEPFLREVEIVIEPVLQAIGYRGDLLELGRVTHRGRDRLYRYWGGGAQDGNYDLLPSSPATNDRRLSEVLGALEWVVASFGPVSSIAVNGPRGTLRSAQQVLADRSPETDLVDWPLER